jgi:glycosyltransferase involved in cell wall biosynthesis
MNWLTRRSVLASVNGLRHASRIVAVSQFTADRLTRYLPEVADRTVVIPNGVDVRFLAYRSSKAAARQAIERLLSHSLSEPIILYVGSEQPRKNVTTVLEAFRRLRAVYPTAQLIKVGRPGHPRWREATMARAAGLGLRVGADLVILEDIDDDDLAHTYRAADLFVSASSYEGFGLPVLEAMAVGTPVVISDCGAHPEVTAGHGWLARPDVEAFEVAMLSALANAEQAARTERAMRHAATLTWGRSAGRYLEELQRLCEP